MRPNFMKYPPITYNLLKEKKACAKHLALFKKHIGLNKPIPLTDETIEKFGSVFDISWAALNLLTPSDYQQFLNTQDLAFMELEKSTKDFTLKKVEACERATRKYSKIIKSTYENQEVKNRALIQWKIATDAAWDKYDISSRTFEIKYLKVQAAEFVRLYKKGMK